MEPAPERYRGLFPFAEARAITLTFALPVLRQGDLPLFGERRFILKRLLAEAEGWYALFAVFFAKSVTARELEQEGAFDRIWRDGLDGFL